MPCIRTRVRCPAMPMSWRSAELFTLIKGLHQEGMTVIMVEQNALDALEIADRGYLLVDGSNAREGDARALAADAEVRHAFLGG